MTYTDTDVELVAEVVAGALGLEAWQVRLASRSALRALAAAGRLTPAGGETRTEWGIWWHAGVSDGIVLDEARVGSRERADRRGGERIGDYGITRYTLHRREHRDYADGSTLVGPWLPVPVDPTPLVDRLGDTWASPVTVTGFDTEEDTDG